MPNYPGTGRANTLLNTNRQVLLWNAERVASGTASMAVQLERQKSASYPNGVSVEISFDGAPGTYEVDIQTADTDTDAAYVTIAQSASVNSGNYDRVEMTNIWAKYIRTRIAALTSDVKTTVKVSR